MTALLGHLVSLASPADREATARAIGAALGGERLLVFVRDPEVGALLPAPGFPQTLRGARDWRAFLEACASGGERVGEVTPPDGEAPVPAHGFACGPDVVAVVVGADRRSPHTERVRELLPLLGAVFRGERAAAHAETQARLARQATAHAEALARSLDGVRAQLQRALATAQAAREEAEATNRQLQDQTAELEMQTDVLQRTNTDLEVARRGAEAASRAKSEFLATMSHELRTPLNAIGGHAQIVALGIHGPVTAAQHEALDRIDRSQRHLLGLINDILNLSRIESGRMDYAVEDVALADVVAGVAPMVEPQIAARGLRLAVRLHDPDAAVRADPDKLQQILLNLLSNATKFTEPGGLIEIASGRAADAPGVVVVRVRDTGRGIPPEKLEMIFEPFTQVNATHSRTEQGTGLGLAISRDLARGMRGDLTAVSEVGAGSTFMISLPAAGSAPR